MRKGERVFICPQIRFRNSKTRHEHERNRIPTSKPGSKGAIEPCRAIARHPSVLQSSPRQPCSSMASGRASRWPGRGCIPCLMPGKQPVDRTSWRTQRRLFLQYGMLPFRGGGWARVPSSRRNPRSRSSCRGKSPPVSLRAGARRSSEISSPGFRRGVLECPAYDDRPRPEPIMGIPAAANDAHPPVHAVLRACTSSHSHAKSISTAISGSIYAATRAYAVSFSSFSHHPESLCAGPQPATTCTCTSSYSHAKSISTATPESIHAATRAYAVSVSHPEPFCTATQPSTSSSTTSKPIHADPRPFSSSPTSWVLG